MAGTLTTEVVPDAATLRRERRDRALIAVDLLGAMLGSQAAARQMVAQGTGGVIVNTASLAGITPGAGVMSYRVAKAGVIHFTRCLALELAQHGIRVNAVAPANIATAISST